MQYHSILNKILSLFALLSIASCSEKCEDIIIEEISIKKIDSYVIKDTLYSSSIYDENQNVFMRVYYADKNIPILFVSIKDNLKNGPLILFDVNGRVAKIENYKNGLIIGKPIIFDSTGIQINE